MAQAVFDAMFSDMDINLREMGVGDMGVARNVRAMWEAFHGRATVYEAALDDPDPAVLDAALARNVWRGGEPDQGHRLGDLVRVQMARLEATRPESLFAGRVQFAASGLGMTAVSELARPLALERIGAGLTMVVEADEAECAAIAARLLVPSVERLRCAWTLSPFAGWSGGGGG